MKRLMIVFVVVVGLFGLNATQSVVAGMHPALVDVGGGVLSALAPEEVTVLSADEAQQIKGTYQCTEYIYSLTGKAIFNKDKKGNPVWGGKPTGGNAAYRDAKYWYSDAKDKWHYGTSKNYIDPNYIMVLGTDIGSHGHVAMTGSVRWIGTYLGKSNVLRVTGIKQANLLGKGEVDNSNSSFNTGYFAKEGKFKYNGWKTWYGVNGFITNWKK